MAFYTPKVIFWFFFVWFFLISSYQGPLNTENITWVQNGLIWFCPLSCTHDVTPWHIHTDTNTNTQANILTNSMNKNNVKTKEPSGCMLYSTIILWGLNTVQSSTVHICFSNKKVGSTNLGKQFRTMDQSTCVYLQIHAKTAFGCSRLRSTSPRPC